MGYDLEVHTSDGVKFLEVKSVNRIGDTISITNNEYSTANELGFQYSLAIVKQTDNELEVCIIKNPVKDLNFVKRVTKWEWIADEYAGYMIKYKF